MSHGGSRLRVRFVVDSVRTHAVDSAVIVDSTTTLASCGPDGQLRTDVRGWQRLRTGSEGAQNQNLRVEDRILEISRVDGYVLRRAQWLDVSPVLPSPDRRDRQFRRRWRNSQFGGCACDLGARTRSGAVNHGRDHSRWSRGAVAARRRAARHSRTVGGIGPLLIRLRKLQPVSTKPCGGSAKRVAVSCREPVSLCLRGRPGALLLAAARLPGRAPRDIHDRRHPP